MKQKYILSVMLILTLLVSAASAASLSVGPAAKYKTIQSALNSANNGDIINVAAGTYKESIVIYDKSVSFQGQAGKYPSVYGFTMSWSSDKLGSANINGFSITRDGVRGGLLGGNTIRNNKFSNCGISGGGPEFSNNVIMNNLFTNGGIYLDDRSTGNTVTGNTFSKSKIGLGLYMGASGDKISGNTFSGCGIGVQCYKVPNSLTGNKYSGNKVNIKTGVYSV
jgi:parallel beta-helix repeat protein